MDFGSQQPTEALLDAARKDSADLYAAGSFETLVQPRHSLRAAAGLGAECVTASTEGTRGRKSHLSAGRRTPAAGGCGVTIGLTSPEGDSPAPTRPRESGPIVLAGLPGEGPVDTDRPPSEPPPPQGAVDEPVAQSDWVYQDRRLLSEDCRVGSPPRGDSQPSTPPVPGVSETGPVLGPRTLPGGARRARSPSLRCCGLWDGLDGRTRCRRWPRIYFRDHLLNFSLEAAQEWGVDFWSQQPTDSLWDVAR